MSGLWLSPPPSLVVTAKGGAISCIWGQDLCKSPLLPNPTTWTCTAWWWRRGWHSSPLSFTSLTAHWVSLHEIIWPFLLNQRSSESLVLADILISREQFFPAPVNRTLKVNGIIVLISKWIIQKVLHISASIILWNYINVLNTVLPF